MSISKVTIPVPTTGEGAFVDTSGLVGRKTVVFTGTFRGVFSLLGSQDDVHFTSIAQFDAGGVEGIQQTVDGAFKSMRLRAATPATAPLAGVTCEVSAESGAGQNFFATLATLAAGAAPGTTPVVDLASVIPPTGPEEDICFLCTGGLVGQLVVLGSLDGIDFCPVGSFRRDRVPEGAPVSAEFSVLPTLDKVRYVRLSLEGQVGSPLVVTVGGRVPATVVVPIVVANWPLSVGGVPWGRYFFLDGDNGNDANAGYVDAALGTVFTPAQAAAVAVRTTDRLEEIIPPVGNGRAYVVLVKPRAGRAIYDASVPGDAQGGFRRDHRSGYSLELMRGSDLTNSLADRAQLGMVTVAGPLTVASAGFTSYGPYARVTTPVGITPENMGRYRVRVVTGSGTFYAACQWGDPSLTPDPTIIQVWTNSWGPVAPGDTLYLEEPGVRIRDFYETVVEAILPAASDKTVRAQLAGVEVGADTTGFPGNVYLGANMGGGDPNFRVPPTYSCVRSFSPVKIVGSLSGSNTFTDEVGNAPQQQQGNTGIELVGGCTSVPPVDDVSFTFSYLDNSVNLVAKKLSMLGTFVRLLTIEGGSEKIDLQSVLYEEIFLNPEAFCSASGCRWVPLDVSRNGITVAPPPGATPSLRFSGIGAFYGPEPPDPGFILSYGQYTTTFDLNTTAAPITAGTGVLVKLSHPYFSPSPEVLVTYASLAVTGFEVEGAQKVVVEEGYVGYPGGTLPCPRGIVMQMVDGVVGTAHPTGLVVAALGSATPDRFDLASASGPDAVIGALLTNVVQGDGANPGGWAVVGRDSLTVLVLEPATSVPAPGDLLYLSDVTPGRVVKTPPGSSATPLARCLPVGPGTSLSGVLFASEWLGDGAGSTASSADWPVGMVRHFLVDPVGGDDANPGYVDALPNASSIASAGRAVQTLARYMNIVPRTGNGRMAVSHFANGDQNAGTAMAGTLDYSAFSGYAYFLVRAWTNFDPGIACWSARDRVIAGARIALPGPNPDGSWTVNTVSTVQTLTVTVAAGGAALASDAATLFRLRFTGNVTPAMADLRCTVYKSFVDTIETCEPPQDNQFNIGTPAAGDTFFIERPGFMIDGFREMTCVSPTAPDPFLQLLPNQTVRATVGIGIVGGQQSASLGSAGLVQYCFCETTSAANSVATGSSHVARMNFHEWFYAPDMTQELPWAGFRFAGVVAFNDVEEVGWGSSSGSVRAPNSTTHGVFAVSARSIKIVGASMGGVFLGGLSLDADEVVFGTGALTEDLQRRARVVRVLEVLSNGEDSTSCTVSGVTFDNGLLKLGSAVRSSIGCAVYVANCGGGPVAGCATNTGIYCRNTQLHSVVVDGASVTLTGAGGDVQLANGVILSYAELAVADFTDSTGTKWVGAAGSVFYGSPRPGARLTNADATVAPGTDKTSFYELPAGTLTANHQVTVQVTSMLPRQAVCIRRRDLSANTYAVVNGGGTPGTLVTTPASPGAVLDVWVKLNAAGTDVELDRVEYKNA